MACPLWQGLDRLETALAEIVPELPGSVPIAVTMTGELVDLFADRKQGVAAIVGQLVTRFGEPALAFFAGKEGFLDVDGALRQARAVASANWRATGQWVASLLPEGLLVDCGSTTTDILPFARGRVLARGDNDRARLACGELVYQGCIRTPLCSIADRAPFAGAWHAVMNEWFATSADVWRLLGELDERVDLHPAADRGAKTAEGSARRLARTIGCDLDDAPFSQWLQLAHYFASRQLDALEQGARLVLSRGELAADAPVVATGAGAFVVAHLATRLCRPVILFETLVGLKGELGRMASVVAPAFAVARLLLRSLCPEQGANAGEPYRVERAGSTAAAQGAAKAEIVGSECAQGRHVSRGQGAGKADQEAEAPGFADETRELRLGEGATQALATLARGVEHDAGETGRGELAETVERGRTVGEEHRDQAEVGGERGEGGEGSREIARKDPDLDVVDTGRADLDDPGRHLPGNERQVADRGADRTAASDLPYSRANR